MITITQLQRDNLLEAKKMWLTVPEANVSYRLSAWRISPDKNSAPDCNTISCFGGWCAWYPAFRDQGLKASIVGGPEFATRTSDVIASYDASYRLFGLYEMFVSRGAVRNRGIFCSETEAGSDWQIVMNRIDSALANTVTL